MEAVELRLLSLFRNRTTPADEELKREVEAQLEVAKDKYETARTEGAPLPKIDWDVAQRLRLIESRLAVRRRRPTD